MYPWAVNFREMGVDGLWKMGIFLAVLVAGLVYEVKRKALDWD
jgi:NADH-quinone oxidoreductase subunit A